MATMPIIRPYQPSDKTRLLVLFQENCPQFFSPEEEADLIFYLDHELEDYFVLEWEGRIVGSGGINIDHQIIGKISWDLMEPSMQGKGLGSRLLQYRIQHLKTKPQILEIRVRTSQLVFGFYEKNGFYIESIVKDYWAPGYDLVEMKYRELSF